MKLIDKDAVLSIIEKLKDEALEYGDKSRWFLVAALTRRIEALEVKEVDLEKEIKKIQREYKTTDEYEGYPAHIYSSGIELIAKHFFELGLKAQKK